MKPVLAVLAVAAPLLTGCLIPDAPFQGAAPRTATPTAPAPPRPAPKPAASRPAAQKPAPAPEPSGRPDPPAPVFTIPHSAPPAPGEVLPAPQVPQPPGASASDTCASADLAFLVGRRRTEIPIPADLTRRRVVCSGCPVTQDFRPDRQTITYDPATNRVTKVACG